MVKRVNFGAIQWYDVLAAVGGISSIVWMVFDPEVRRRLRDTVTNPWILIFSLFNISFAYYIFSLKPSAVFGMPHDVTTAESLERLERLRYATQHAMIAFIVAYLAYLDYYTAAFWVIWYLLYYMSP